MPVPPTFLPLCDPIHGDRGPRFARMQAYFSPGSRSCLGATNQRIRANRSGRHGTSRRATRSAARHAKEAARRAWATVNEETGGGKKSGSGRGKKVNKAPSRKGGREGRAGRGAAAQGGPAAASARKGARTRCPAGLPGEGSGPAHTAMGHCFTAPRTSKSPFWVRWVEARRRRPIGPRPVSHFLWRVYVDPEATWDAAGDGRRCDTG